MAVLALMVNLKKKQKAFYPKMKVNPFIHMSLARKDSNNMIKGAS